MRIVVRTGHHPVAHHLADVELVWDEIGVRLTGIAVWKHRDGRPGVAVTLPRLRGKKEGEHWSVLRDATRGNGGVAQLQQTIIEAFRSQVPGEALRASLDEPAAGA